MQRMRCALENSFGASCPARVILSALPSGTPTRDGLAEEEKHAMAEAKHTPGEWVQLGGSSAYYDVMARYTGHDVTQLNGEMAFVPICRVKKHAAGEANLRLVLAAPKLLAACQAALDTLDEGYAESSVCPVLRAAISKALGKDVPHG